jgi:hypothetical protein
MSVPLVRPLKWRKTLKNAAILLPSMFLGSVITNIILTKWDQKKSGIVSESKVAGQAANNTDSVASA